MERIKTLLRRTEPVRWLFYSDSITHGVKHTNGSRDFSEPFRERVLWKLQRRSDLVLNSACSGFKTADLLRDFAWRAKAFMPHAAFVMIGSNDSADGKPDDFAGQLEELLDNFRAIGCEVVLETPLPVLRDLDEKRSRLPQFAETVRAVARRNHVPLIDHFERWRNDSAEFYLHADCLHPNGLGHIKMAHDIFRALDIFDPATSGVCSFFVPKTL
ncbi:hypothetical protein SDC9_105143 [bioreactor metagenome]|uniref:SGNH hydrolase-type esterase domain-containing protein n=1 Tax=bioreactor metagenome TaxID=1076179 RepID=A0A645AYG2_9ZZZZ